jgi:heat shock protein HslJ
MKRSSSGIVFALLFVAACRAVTPTPSVSALGGVQWRLIDLNGKSALPAEVSARPWLRFSTDSLRVTGNLGCNNGSGSFTPGADQAIRFGPIASTRRACIDEQMNAQESAFAAAIQASDSWRITGDTLELRQSDRLLARFVKQ